MNYNGYPVYIATKECQIRKHHKKRINKKWRKRYGIKEYNMMPDGEVMFFDGAVWMTRRTFEQLKVNKKEK